MMREIERIDQFWQSLSRDDRGKLLIELGFNDSWAILDTMDEIGSRDGAFVAKDLIKVIKMRLEYNV